jgi:peptidoglycan/LPS O-acetylase OafA/YrhL
MKYRAEIDGLRALAVLPVILFHAGFEWFSGGFVGVDVFFVISGYLITTIIIADIEGERFSIANFYERRARRILPALFFVMFITVLPAYFVMLPDELQNFGQSLVATTFFVNNVLLGLTTDYWALEAEYKPLIHTWSLGIEEQYYLLFPFFLTLTWKFGKEKVFWMIVVLTIFSLLLSEWGWRKEPTFNYYLSPARAWELFAGSLAAFFVYKNGVKNNNVLALFGLAGILFSIFFYDENTPFPSIYAAVPVIGVVLLVLYAGKETLVAKLLGNKGFVGMGLISYSAYLWHVPILAYLRTISMGELTWTSSLMAVLLTIIFATLTWKFIEQPFRKLNGFARNKFIILITISSIFFTSIGITLHFTEGFSKSFYGSSNYGSASVWTKYNDNVDLDYGDNNFDDTKQVKVLVVGTSYARDLINAMAEAGITNKIDLSYRHNKEISHCNLADKNANNYLVNRAEVVIFGFDVLNECSRAAFDNLKRAGKTVYFATHKHFGYNLSWIRLELILNGELANPYSKRTDSEILLNSEIKKIFSKDELIDIQQFFRGSDNSLVRIADSKDRLFTVDRTHLTQPGAQFLGNQLILSNHPLIQSLIKSECEGEQNDCESKEEH